MTESGDSRRAETRASMATVTGVCRLRLALGQPRLKFAAPRSDNRGMRWVLLLLLALSGLAFAPRALPRGSDRFHLAMTRVEVDSTLAARGLTILSGSPSHIACAGDVPQVEYEQYDFAPSAYGPGLLWRVTVAYGVPYQRADFDSLRDDLTALLGEPAQVDEPEAGEIGATHKVTWVDAHTSVQLAARWNEHPDPRTDRMLVVWTDRRLQKMVEAQRRRAGGSSGSPPAR